MGMYTELHLNSEIRKDTPENVLRVLRYMLSTSEEEAAAISFEKPDHPLFGETRWRFMLLSDSYYFDADTHSTLRFDDIAKSHYLCIRCNLKNYDREIAKFCDWVAPYLDKQDGEFLGFSRYETDEWPTLLFYGRGKDGIARVRRVETIPKDGG